MKLWLGRLLAVWALIVFAVSLLLIFLPIWIAGLWPEPRRSHIIQPVFTAWMKIFFVLTGVRRRITGKEHFKKGENYIVVCNHRSLIDPPISSPGIPGANKTIAKIEFAKITIFGVIYKRGSVLVDRRNEESRKASYGKMKDVLLSLRLHMCIYPEGTRNTSNLPLQKFHDGAFKLATDTGKSIIPSVIINSAKILPPKKGFYFWPAKVEMHFMAPISSAGKTVQQLKEEVFEIMQEKIVAG